MCSRLPYLSDIDDLFGFEKISSQDTSLRLIEESQVSVVEILSTPLSRSLLPSYALPQFRIGKVMHRFPTANVSIATCA